MGRLLTATSILATLAICACGRAPGPGPAASASSPAPSPAAPSDPAADVAAANQLPEGQVNFRVCLSNALDARDPAPLDIPTGTIFESWGKKDGDERNPKLDADMLKPDAVRYEVVLVRPLRLSKQQPCAETVAQTAHSDIFEWRRPLVRRSQDLQFQVIGVENHMAFPLKDRLGGIIKAGLIFGYSTGDIGHPRQMKEEG